MPSLEINTGSRPYFVHIGEGIRRQCSKYLFHDYSAVLIITDSVVDELYFNDVASAFSDFTAVYRFVVPAGEESKNYEQFYRLQTEAIQLGLDRRSLIVALGGGVVGDLAGFVAATFMRGIDYIQVPTTVLAHDSSVGGKVGINHEKGKNLIGSFHQPVAVIYDVETLLSLPAKEVRSGYAEVIKHGLIQDKELFVQLTKSENRLIEDFTTEELETHLLKGIAVKASIVEQDERENDIRKYLNFGHTLGHALESELGYGKLTHGEAIAIGMLFAIRVSEEVLGADLPYSLLKRWLTDNHYPLKLEGISLSNIIEKMKRDKKAERGTIQMVLLEKIGRPLSRELDDAKVSQIAKNFFKELSDT